MARDSMRNLRILLRNILRSVNKRDIFTYFFIRICFYFPENLQKNCKGTRGPQNVIDVKGTMPQNGGHKCAEKKNSTRTSLLETAKGRKLFTKSGSKLVWEALANYYSQNQVCPPNFCITTNA